MNRQKFYTDNEDLKQAFVDAVKASNSEIEDVEVIYAEAVTNAVKGLQAVRDSGMFNMFMDADAIVRVGQSTGEEITIMNILNDRQYRRNRNKWYMDLLQLMGEEASD